MAAPIAVSTKLTSAAFSGRDSFEAFRETYGRAVMQLEIEPHPDHAFELDFSITAIPDFSVASGRLSPALNRHTPKLADNDDIVLIFTPRGRGAIEQFGRRADLRDGEATFLSNGITALLHGYEPSLLTTFRFKRQLLGPFRNGIEAALVKTITRDNAALRMLTQYATLIDDLRSLATPELSLLVSGHMHALARILLRSYDAPIEGAGRRAMRAAKLKALQNDIEANIGSATLTVDALAARHGISPRAIRRLFQEADTTFADYVLERRLIRSH